LDPISQGVLGAVAAQQCAPRKQLGFAAIAGWLGGMAADADVIFRSSEDPLFRLEMHRQFTHSLIFIPFGGLIVASVIFWLWARRQQISFKTTYLLATLGYATHGLLDTCTSYGTQLLWPLTDLRVAWNSISIIDPLVTIPLLVLIVCACWRKSKWYAYAAALWCLIYFTFGVVQRERAAEVGLDLAQSRSHFVDSVAAKPSFANLLVWKTIYEYNNRYYVDAVRVGLEPQVFPGDSVAKLHIPRDFPWLDMDSQQARDIERFRWFSNDYLAVSPINSKQIIDMRYSAIPNEVRGLWAIELSPTALKDEHVAYEFDRQPSLKRFDKLFQMLW